MFVTKIVSGYSNQMIHCANFDEPWWFIEMIEIYDLFKWLMNLIMSKNRKCKIDSNDRDVLSIWNID